MSVGAPFFIFSPGVPQKRSSHHLICALEFQAIGENNAHFGYTIRSGRHFEVRLHKRFLEILNVKLKIL